MLRLILTIVIFTGVSIVGFSYLLHYAGAWPTMAFVLFMGFIAVSYFVSLFLPQ